MVSRRSAGSRVSDGGAGKIRRLLGIDHVGSAHSDEDLALPVAGAKADLLPAGQEAFDWASFGFGRPNWRTLPTGRCR